MDLFITATRNKFRFASSVGSLTVEQLWDLPLTSTRGASLDNVGRLLLAELRGLSEESLVAVNTPAKDQVQARIDIVKHIISVKQAEETAAREESTRRAQKAKLLEALSRKQDAALETMTVEQIREALDRL